MSERGPLTAAARQMILLIVASASGVLAASHCPPTKPAKARFRTIAWVSTTCRTDPSGLVGHQELYVQRGDQAPIVVSQAAVGPVPDPLALCRLFGSTRLGTASVVAGSYIRLAVSPDGARVVFELNDGFSLLEPDRPRLTEEEKGLYVARTDGGDPVRLGPATGVSPFLRLPSGATDLGNSIAFSPDGRYVAYTDLGPASDGNLDAQLWSLRLADGKRVQLTHLARLPDGTNLLEYVFDFANTNAIGFYTFDFGPDPGVPRQEFYSVSVDGTGLRKVSPVVGPNGQPIAQFALTGRRPAVQGLFVEGTPENPMLNIDKPRELFVAFGKRVLQLTHFNRVDVGNSPTAVSRNGKRVFFSASADPFGCNPTHNCQVFSIDTLGGHLRQLTRFAEGDRSDDGCFFSPAPGCHVTVAAQDRATGTLILGSSCDPFGTNPAGEQLFVVRADGTGLRQITHSRGVVTDTPDVVEVELPGPFAYQ